MIRQPLVLSRQRQQHLHDRVTTPVIDRLGLAPLHTTRFDNPALCPPDRLNASGFSSFLESVRLARGVPVGS
jgi:hypothetical protein